MIFKFLLQLLVNKSTKIQHIKFVDLSYIYSNLYNDLTTLIKTQNELKSFSIKNIFNIHILNSLQHQARSISHLEFDLIDFHQITFINYLIKFPFLSSLI